MTASGHRWRVSVLVLAVLLLSLSCKRFMKVFTPQPQQPLPAAALDEPPLPHQGELSVMSVGPSGQGPSSSPGSHGSPLAGGIAAGVGLIVVGATVTKTVSECSKPGASPRCLRGPGPAESESDAGSP